MMSNRVYVQPSRPRPEPLPPEIRESTQGPLLYWNGYFHWLTWRERLAVWIGWESAETLADKRWGGVS